MQYQHATARLLQPPMYDRFISEDIGDVLCNLPARDSLLTQHRGTQVNCNRSPSHQPKDSLLESGLKLTVDWLKSCGHPTLLKPTRKLIDLGCGPSGTPLANLLEAEVAGTETFWVDRYAAFLDKLNKPTNRKYCADAASLPFANATFDLATLDGVIARGVSKYPNPSDPIGDATSFAIVSEAARILASGGLLVVNFFAGTRDQAETLANIRDAGFGRISHIHRDIVFGGIPNDMYALERT